jgi:hypothetical protein
MRSNVIIEFIFIRNLHLKYDDKPTTIMKRDIAPKYVDGFVLAVPKNKINEYLRLARMCGKM